MTQAPTNLGLTPDAEARFDDYIRQVRAALASAADVSPDEIEADIREHVENELRSAARPIALFVLEAVLNRLGPPTQWLPAGKSALPAEFPSLWRYARERLRGVAHALWRGPEDWRLPYLAFGTFAIGVLAFPIFPFFLLVSYLLARAGIAVTKERGIELGAGRKWLLYPPLILVNLVLFLALMVCPPIFATFTTFDEVLRADSQERWELAGRPRGVPYPRFQRYLSNTSLKDQYPGLVTTLDKVLAQFPSIPRTPEAPAVLFLFLGFASFWGAVVGLLSSRLPATVRALFFPLANRFGGKWAVRVGLVCLAGFVAWCALAYQIATNAGLL